MTTSQYMPDVKVEIAFDAGYTTAPGSRTWTDVSQWVELRRNITIEHGRADELSTAEPNRLSATLNNRDGRFTPELTSGAYYPNVKIGRPVRLTATPVGGSVATRFFGFIESWPPKWDGGTDADSTVTITVLSRTSRLAAGVDLGNLLDLSAPPDAPWAYYALDEEVGAPTARERSTGVALTSFEAVPTPPGSITFGNEIPLAGGTARAMTIVNGDPGVNGIYLASRLARPCVLKAGQPIAIELFVKSKFTYPSGLVNPVLVGMRDSTDPDTLPELTLGYNYMDGLPRVKVFGSSYTWPAAPVLDDNKIHHVALIVADAGGDEVTANIWVDGVDYGSTPSLSSGSYTSVGGTSYYGPTIGVDTQGTLAHVVIRQTQGAGWVSDRADAGRIAFEGELAGDRIARYATWGGVDPSELTIDANTHPVSKVDPFGRTPLALMRDVEVTEGGVLYDGADEHLVFAGRAARYNAAVALTLSAVDQQIGADLAPVLDRFGLANDITATDADGVEWRLADDASVDEYGRASESVTVMADGNAAFNAAAWRRFRRSTPRVRVPTVSIDVLALTSGQQAALLGADIGSRIRITDLPSQAPSSTVDFFIEGYTETIGPETYVIDLNLSSAFGYDVFTLDDPVQGVLDSTYPLAY